MTELLRTGAEQLIYQAVDAELRELLVAHSRRRLVDGRAGVVRNGYLPARELQTGLGPVTVRIPKVRAKTGEPVTFHSALVPRYVRKTRTLEAALPWLYLKGISSSEMGAALAVLVGAQAKGLSASTVSRLKQVWAQEYRSWSDERLDKDRWVYVWAVNVKQVVALVSRGYRVCVLTARHFYWALGRQGHRRRRRPVSCPA